MLCKFFSYNFTHIYIYIYFKKINANYRIACFSPGIQLLQISSQCCASNLLNMVGQKIYIFLQFLLKLLAFNIKQSTCNM